MKRFAYLLNANGNVALYVNVNSRRGMDLNRNHCIWNDCCSSTAMNEVLMDLGTAAQGTAAKGKRQRAKGKGQRAKGKGQRAKGKGQRAKGRHCIASGLQTQHISSSSRRPITQQHCDKECEEAVWSHHSSHTAPPSSSLLPPPPPPPSSYSLLLHLHLPLQLSRIGDLCQHLQPETLRHSHTASLFPTPRAIDHQGRKP